MIVSARVASDSDATQVSAIADVLGDEIRDRRGGAVHLAEVARFYQQRKADRRIVGCVDDQIVGFVDLMWSELPGSVKLGEVVAFGVLSEFRSVGVGEAMLNMVVAECRAEGCTGIDAAALPGERETKNFFETFGFTARRLVVHHAL